MLVGLRDYVASGKSWPKTLAVLDPSFSWDNGNAGVGVFSWYQWFLNATHHVSTQTSVIGWTACDESLVPRQLPAIKLSGNIDSCTKDLLKDWPISDACREELAQSPLIFPEVGPQRIAPLSEVSGCKDDEGGQHLPFNTRPLSEVEGDEKNPDIAAQSVDDLRRQIVLLGQAADLQSRAFQARHAAELVELQEKARGAEVVGEEIRDLLIEASDELAKLEYEVAVDGSTLAHSRARLGAAQTSDASAVVCSGQPSSAMSGMCNRGLGWAADERAGATAGEQRGEVGARAADADPAAGQ